MLSPPDVCFGGYLACVCVCECVCSGWALNPPAVASRDCWIRFAAPNAGYPRQASPRRYQDSHGISFAMGRAANRAARNARIAKLSGKGTLYVDYKDVDELRRLMTPNGKMYGRKRLGVSAREQRLISQAIKRARYIGLLPFTDATL